jgi:hypothetical protein
MVPILHHAGILHTGTQRDRERDPEREIETHTGTQREIKI